MLSETMLWLSMIALVLWSASLAFFLGVMHSERFREWVAPTVLQQARVEPSGDPEAPQKSYAATSRVPWAQRRRDLERQHAAPQVEEE